MTGLELIPDLIGRCTYSLDNSYQPDFPQGYGIHKHTLHHALVTVRQALS